MRPNSLPSWHSLPFPLLQMDEKGVWAHSNNAWNALFTPGFSSGFTSSFTSDFPFDSGASWKTVLSDPCLTKWQTLIDETALEGGKFRMEAMLHTAAGDKRFVLTAGRDPDAPGWLVTATEVEDVLEKIEVGYEQDQVAMRIAEQRWYSFFRESATGKAIVDLEGAMLAVNPQLCHLYGYDESEMLAIRPRDLRHPDYNTRMENVYQSLLDGGPPVLGVSGKYQKRDGSLLELLISFSLVRDSRGHPLYFAVEMQDDSARLAAEAALEIKVRETELLNTELVRSNADLERFAFVASHDLQEPLRKIRVFGSRLGSIFEKAQIDPQNREYLDRMLAAAARMQQLISDLLEFSRPREPKAFTNVDLKALVIDAAGDFEASLELSGGRIEVGELPVVRGEASRLRQLMSNLIGNALKFHGEEPPVVEIWAERVEHPEKFTLSQEGNQDSHRHSHWHIFVRDNGIGFNESELPRLLEIFGRLHPRQKYAGTGIGLAICRKVAQEHGGDITATSEPGQGATFIISLPDNSS